MSKNQRSWSVTSYGALFIAVLLLVAPFLAGCASLLSATQLPIISEGRSPYTIVVPDKPLPSTKLAATELQKYLEKRTGVKLPIVQEGKSPAENRIFIGPCAAAAKAGIPASEKARFNIKVIGKDLYITGNDTDGTPLRCFTKCQTGSLYGVCALLRRFAGVRWLWPGDLGTVVPKSKTFQIDDDLEFSDGPYFAIRNLWVVYGRRNPREDILKYAYWYRHTGQGQLYSGNSGHAYSRLIGGNKYFKEHPEYYALTGGERRPIRKGRQICTSNNDVIRICTETALKQDRDIVSLSPNDGCGFCECAECRALDDPKNIMMWGGKPMVALTDRIFTFVNAVAEKVKKKQPDKMLGHYAYTFFKQPPRRLKKLNDNIALFFAYGCHWYRSPEMKKLYRGYIDKWATFGTKMVGREYYGLVYWHDMPNIHTRLIDEDIKYLEKHNFLGVNSECCLNFSTCGVNYYLATRLLWNPELTRDEILDDYYTAGFGPAAADVAEYFDIFERRLASLGAYAAGSGNANIDHLDVEFDPETLLCAKKNLDAAYAKTIDPTIKKRLDFIKIGYDYTETTSKLITLLKKLKATGMTFSRLSSAKLDKEPSREEIIAMLDEAIALHNKRWRIIDSQGALPALHIPELKHAAAHDRWGKELLSRYKLIFAGVAGKLLKLPLEWRFKVEKPEDGVAKGWQKPDFQDKDWELLKTNMPWEKQGHPALDGVGWYRVAFEVSPKEAAAPGASAILTIGAIDESGWVWLNGEKIGEYIFDEKKNPTSWREPHEINVTGKLKPGRNVIAVRVRDEIGGGGLWRPSHIIFKNELDNLLRGSTFEKGMGRWRSKALKTTSCGITDADGYNSKHSLKVTLEKPLAKSPLSLNVLVGKVKSNTTYSLAFHYKTKNIQKRPVRARSPFIRVIFRGKDGRSVTPPNGYLWAQTRMNSNVDSWNQRDVLFKTPSGTTSLAVTVFFYNAGTYLLDDFELCELKDFDNLKGDRVNRIKVFDPATLSRPEMIKRR
ncbi:MAG: DUF4838 domain-containing protein [Victivallales bacterium]|nr:DUF4838 domain-containing protein [Victivallales bacterium]